MGSWTLVFRISEAPRGSFLPHIEHPPPASSTFPLPPNGPCGVKEARNGRVRWWWWWWISLWCFISGGWGWRLPDRGAACHPSPDFLPNRSQTRLASPVRLVAGASQALPSTRCAARRPVSSDPERPVWDIRHSERFSLLSQDGNQKRQRRDTASARGPLGFQAREAQENGLEGSGRSPGGARVCGPRRGGPKFLDPVHGVLALLKLGHVEFGLGAIIPAKPNFSCADGCNDRPNEERREKVRKRPAKTKGGEA